MVDFHGEYMVKKIYRYMRTTDMLFRVVLSSNVQISKCMNAQVSTSWVLYMDNVCISIVDAKCW
jgi:hypothetical protein